MSSDVNVVVLTGRLCADPEMREATSEVVVARLRIAVDSRGDRLTDFFSATAFGKLATQCERLVRGQELSLTGRLVLERWTADDGSKRERVSVICNDVQFGRVPRKAAELRWPREPRRAGAVRGSACTTRRAAPG